MQIRARFICYSLSMFLGIIYINCFVCAMLFVLNLYPQMDTLLFIYFRMLSPSIISFFPLLS